MIFTKSKIYGEITNQLDRNDVIAIISCTSCARVAGTGGEEPMKALAMLLREDGYSVQEGYTINTMCTPKVFQAKLDKKVNTILSLACSAGTANVKKLFEGYKVVETTIDVGLMSADNKKRTIKVEKPYEGYLDTKGKEFEMFTGKSIEEIKIRVEVAI